jgi:AAA15 family ATPase/GTPase
MLIRFLATNFLSFNEETEFNMLSSSDQRTHKEHVYTRNGLDLLKGAAIYGANGAGKSNFVKAIDALKTIVFEGGKRHLKDLEEFKLSQERDKPIILEIEFIREGTPFLYGLSVHNELIVEEWLYVSDLGKDPDQLLFHRTLENGRLILKFAEEYIRTEEDRFRLKFYQDELLKNDELLLKELADLKEGFQKVKQAFDWFIGLLVLFPHTKLGVLSLVAQPNQNQQFKQYSDETICSLYTGISEVEVISTDLVTFLGKENENLIEDISRGLRNDKRYIPFSSPRPWGPGEQFIAVLENEKPVVRRVVTKHQNQKGQLIDFSLDEESDGTNRLLDFVPALYGIIHTDSVVIIDEIDQSIHPSLLKELVRKFMANSATKGQLIFTTHESNLLDQNLFRRDEIWFVEKYEGATKMYPLSDFDIRLDLDIRKGYLNGRFGAIPFLGNLKDLNWEQYAEA